MIVDSQVILSGSVVSGSMASALPELELGEQSRAAASLNELSAPPDCSNVPGTNTCSGLSDVFRGPSNVVSLESEDAEQLARPDLQAAGEMDVTEEFEHSKKG